MTLKRLILFSLSMALIVIQNIVIAQQGTPTSIEQIDWSQSGSRFAITTREKLTIYDDALNLIASQDFPSDSDFYVPYIALSPDGSRIYVGNRTDLKILDTTTLEVVVDLNQADVIFNTPDWKNDGTAIAFQSGDDRGTSIYSAIDGNLLRTFSSPQIWRVGYECGRESWSPNGLYFVRAVEDKVFILSALTGEEIINYQITGEAPGCAFWSPDSTRLAFASSVSVPLNSPNSYPDPGSPGNARRASMFVVNAADGTPISTVVGLPSGVGDLTWSPDGKQLAGIDSYHSLYIWNPDTGALIDSYLLPLATVNRLKYSSYSGRLMIGFDGRPISSLTNSLFVPMSTFTQTNFDNAIQFVAPVASTNRLQEIFSQCVSDQDTLTTGNAFITSGQYAAFIEWVNQLPGSIMPTICAADLQLVAQAVIADLPPTATPTNTFTPTDTATNTVTATFPSWQP